MIGVRLPDLVQSLQGRDLGHLHIIAELCGLEFEASDQKSGVILLAEKLLDAELVALIINDLAPNARQALSDLIDNNGWLAWAPFIRRHGPLREMGAGRRDRDRPYLSPVSAAEALWYRGLFGRSFFDTPRGPEEFAYIPSDIFSRLPGQAEKNKAAWGRAASQNEQAEKKLVNDRLLDQACSLLAGLRAGMPRESIGKEFGVDLEEEDQLHSFLIELLQSAGVLGADHQPVPEPTRQLLEMPRGEALSSLVRAWLESSSINELRMLTGLLFEGEWRNEPKQSRKVLLELLEKSRIGIAPQNNSAINKSKSENGDWAFIDLKAFIQDVKHHFPDFQRPSGDYDSWFIRDSQSGEYLRGFDYWDTVDSGYIRFMITGPLYWLGILDLASPKIENAGEAPQSYAFRYSHWSPVLLAGGIPHGLPGEDEPIQVSSDGQIRIPGLAPRAIRYQVARFCEWEGYKNGSFAYRLTASSLKRAQEQGLKASHLLSLLNRYAATVPPTLAKALERWDKYGIQASIYKTIILRVDSPEILKTLQASRASRFLGAVIGPTMVVIKPGAVQKVLRILAELGYMGTFEDEGGW